MLQGCEALHSLAPSGPFSRFSLLHDRAPPPPYALSASHRRTHTSRSSSVAPFVVSVALRKLLDGFRMSGGMAKSSLFACAGEGYFSFVEGRRIEGREPSFRLRGPRITGTTIVRARLRVKVYHTHIDSQRLNGPTVTETMACIPRGVTSSFRTNGHLSKEQSSSPGIG